LSESEEKMSRKRANRPNKDTSGPQGGIDIRAKRDVKINGDVIQGNKTGISHSPPDRKNQERAVVHSAWANGLFYLFTFVIVIGLVSWLAGKLGLAQLAVVILAGILVVPLVGAFQLRMDKRLSDKTFSELVKLVFRQLPLIGYIIKRKL